MAVTERTTWAEEMRRAAELYNPRQAVPEATPCEGPDPYGPQDERWLAIDWRTHLRSVVVEGAETNYVEMGEGPPVLLVHGLAGSWQNWLENIPDLAERHRVVAVDLPGFGASPMPPWEISISAYGRFIHGFCEELGIEKAAVIGSSLGGFVATELAINNPSRVEHLVLVSSAGITFARARREPAAVVGRFVRAAAPIAFKHHLRALHRKRLRHYAYFGLVHDPLSLDPRLLYEITGPGLRCPGLHDAMTALMGYDVRERLRDIEVPTLIVWGRQDRVVPSPAAELYEELIGDNARVEIFNRCGHLPMLERPVRFNALMEQFLHE